MRKQIISDRELVNNFIQGDQSSIETLINRHKDKIFTYILVTVRKEDLAEDIFQDTFIKVIRSLKKGKYKDNGKFLSWVLRIAHNLIIDHFRKEKQLETISTDDHDQNIQNSIGYSEGIDNQKIEKLTLSKDVKKLIDELPYEQKEVILLRHFIGLSFKEISEYTQVSINTALGRMRYALINLRKLIEEKNLVLND